MRAKEAPEAGGGQGGTTRAEDDEVGRRGKNEGMDEEGEDGGVGVGGICAIPTSKGAKAGEETGCRGERITELNVWAD